jgi:hypothetical protein
MTMGPHATAADQIESALRKTSNPLTIDEICRTVFNRESERERNIVRVNLHRLDSRGILVKYSQRYAIEDQKPKETPE